MASSDCKLPAQVDVKPRESLIDRFHWLYAFCREYLFRDQTEEIAQALFPDGPPTAGSHLIELGCGPGVYACRFAQKYPQITTTGIDLSQPLLERAKTRARNLELTNCAFHVGDAQALLETPGSIDAVIVSRLFLIVPNKKAVLDEIFRVLKPGGRCFIAEPTAGFRTRLPLKLMWLLARLSRRPAAEFREPPQAETMTLQEFSNFVRTQPWSLAEVKNDDWYHYAVCAKGQPGDVIEEYVA